MTADATAYAAALARYPVKPGYVGDRYVEDVHRAEREGYAAALVDGPAASGDTAGA